MSQSPQLPSDLPSGGPAVPMSAGDVDQYSDIIDLPHPVSRRHAPMSRQARAVQFIPFAALTGYEAVIEETDRRNEETVDRANAPAPLDDGA